MLVLGFPDYHAQAAALADAIGCPMALVELHTFPDGESRVRLPGALPERVVLCRSLDAPNEKLIELLLVAETARTLGAVHLTLVAPYLCYMRQDRAFHAGEGVSQRIIGRFLADLIDTLITVDPHLHRVLNLNEAVPVARAVALSASRAMAGFLIERRSRALLVGPDRESEQWVRSVAEEAGLEHVVARKFRHGDRDVQILLPEYDYRGREVVLVDDLASTGRTLVVAAQALKEAGAARIEVLVTHALFVADAEAELLAAGVDAIFSSDSIKHSSNAFGLARLLAAAMA